MDPNDTAPVSGARLSPRPTLPGCWFDQQSADNAVNFFTWYIRFSQGDKAGDPFVLEPWQAWIVRQLFGWKQADGRRLYQRVFLWVPRGNGKSEMLAGIALLSLVALGIYGGETYSIAATEQQANVIFKASQQMTAQSPDLRPLLEPLKRSLYCERTHSVFLPLTAKATGKHGLRCSVMLGDEVHEWRDGDLYDFVRRSQIKWREPIEFNISTAGLPEGFGYELFDECEMICDGSLVDPHTLVVTYQARPEDDLLDPAVWKRVNPNLGVSINAEKFAHETRTGLAIPSRAPYVKRYSFNIWSADDIQRAIPADAWAECTAYPGDPDYWQSLEDELAGQECFGGLDLSAGRDLNALLYLFPPAGERTRWAMLPRFWWPRSAVEDIRRRARIPIERWEAVRALSVTNGNASDHSAIAAQVFADMEKFRIQQLGIDAWNAHQITVDLHAAGVPVTPLRFGLNTVAPIWKRFEKMVLDGDLEHGSHPVLSWNAACVALRAPDDNGNTMPTKRRSTGKIDGIAAALMAGVHAFAEPVQQSYLANYDLMVLN